MKRLREARDVYCPRCYSDANEGCRRDNGKPMMGYHIHRWYELDRQQHQRGAA